VIKAIVKGMGAVLVAGCLLLPSAATATQSVSVLGNHFVDAGKPIRLIGVNRSGSEYACAGPVGGGGHGYGFFQGPTSDRSIKGMLKWRINAVALPLNEACWLGGYAPIDPRFSGEGYRQAVLDYVTRLNAHGIIVVLRLSGAAPGIGAYGFDETSSDEIPMADADHSLDFWRSLAATFKDNHQVIFHAFDEPHVIDWPCALNGCATVDMPEGKNRFGPYTAVGHQAIVDAIRASGATQPIVISGIDFAGDVSQWETFVPKDPAGQLVVGFNTFDYSKNFPRVSPDLTRLAATYPVLIGGFGDTNCSSRFSRRLMKFADRAGISYLAWTWNSIQDYGDCSNALLDAGRKGKAAKAYFGGLPSGFGAGVRAHYRKIKASLRY
jgi:endoglucanase